MFLRSKKPLKILCSRLGEFVCQKFCWVIHNSESFVISPNNQLNSILYPVPIQKEFSFQWQPRNLSVGSYTMKCIRSIFMFCVAYCTDLFWYGKRKRNYTDIRRGLHNILTPTLGEGAYHLQGHRTCCNALKPRFFTNTNLLLNGIIFK